MVYTALGLAGFVSANVRRTLLASNKNPLKSYMKLDDFVFVLNQASVLSWTLGPVLLPCQP